MRTRHLVWVGLAVAVLAIAAASGGHASARAGAPCNLTMNLGPRQASNPPGQSHVNVVFTNHGLTRCVLHGWPSVELIGPSYPLFGAIYAVPRQTTPSERVSLPVGGHAHAVLTWLPNGRQGWRPGYIRVVVPTPTGSSFPMAVQWRLGSVLRQDAATHPGTYIGAIRAGSG